MIGQQADILGEHAEHEPVDEMRDRMGIVSTRPQALRQLREFFRRLFGQHLAGLGRLQPLGIEEAGAQHITGRTVEQVVQREFAHLLHRVGPVGVDAEPVHVADDQQRRVIQRDGILLELGEGAVEVLLLALVFPGKAMPAPDIGPAFAPAGFRCALFEGEPFALGVGAGGLFNVEQFAQVEEVFLRCGTFLEFDMAPFGDELGGGHAAERSRAGKSMMPA